MDWTAIGLTLRLAALTTVILVLVGLPLAFWLARSQWRWKFLIEAVVALPLVLPPTVLGFYILMAIGPRSPVGQLYEALTDQLLPFSFQGLLVASVLYSLPFAVRPFAAAFAGVDWRLVEASWCLGKSRLQTFFRIVVPLAWAGHSDRHRPELRAYCRRVWGGADGRGQHPRRHPHCLRFHLRRGAGAELRRRRGNGAFLARPLLRGAMRGRMPCSVGWWCYERGLRGGLRETFLRRPVIRAHSACPTDAFAVTVLFGPSGCGEDDSSALPGGPGAARAPDVSTAERKRGLMLLMGFSCRRSSAGSATFFRTMRSSPT